MTKCNIKKDCGYEDSIWCKSCLNNKELKKNDNNRDYFEESND
ncbi:MULTISPECIES: hypothetical protein [unclassified Clostridium]|nr:MULTISPECIES: hypothetical protein [unclassified Clostridium]